MKVFSSKKALFAFLVAILFVACAITTLVSSNMQAAATEKHGSGLSSTTKAPESNDVVAKIGDVQYNSLDAAVNAAKTGETIEIVKSGTYVLPQSIPNNINIVGLKTPEGNITTVFDATAGGSVSSVPNGAAFKTVKFNLGTTNYHGFQHAGKIKMDDCDINGLLYSYAAMEFNNCRFLTSAEYNMWCYEGNITYTNCNFVNTGSQGALNLYNEGTGSNNVINVSNCTFESKSGSASQYAAIVLKTKKYNQSGQKVVDENIKYQLYVDSNSTATNYSASKYQENFVYGNGTTGNALACTDNKDSKVSNIIVNGAQVWPTAPTPACKIADKEYLTINEALSEAKEGDTIELLKNVELDYSSTGCSLNLNKKGVDLDGHNYSISPSSDANWNQYKTDGASSIYGSYNFVKVTADDVTLKNITVNIKDYRGLSCATTMGGSNVLYDHVTMTGRGSGHYYGYANNGTVSFNNCVITTQGYGIHMSNEGTTGDKVLINDSTVHGWNSFGTCESVIANNTKFLTADDTGRNGKLALFRPYCPACLNNCTFSKEYTTSSVNDCVGLGTGNGSAGAPTVKLYGCKVEDGSDIQNIISYKNAFNDDQAALGSVFAFDPIINDEGYIAGTFQTKADASAITCAKGSNAVKVRDASEGAAPQSGVGAIYLVGKDAEGANNKITKGDFAVDPSKYVNFETHTIVSSGDNQCPFRVKVKEPGDPEQPIIVHEETKVEIGVEPSSSEEAKAITDAASHTEVSGMTEALSDSGKKAIVDKIIKEGTISKKTFEEATLIEYKIKAEVVVKGCDKPDTGTGSLSFKITPVVTVTTHKDGTITGTAEQHVENSYLNGDDITVEIGCGDIIPVQILHTKENGQRELFEKGTEASHTTFLYNSESYNAKFIITEFSTIDVYGTEQFKKLTVNSTVTSKTYDGTDTAEVNTKIISGKEEGDDVSVTATGKFEDSNAGKNKNVNVAYQVVGQDKDKYAVVPSSATIQGDINKRQITLTSDSAQKVYDGTPLVASGVSVSGEGFVGTEGLVYTVTGSQTEVGKSNNTFTYEAKDNTNIDNYDIGKVYGTLEVLSASDNPTNNGGTTTGNTSNSSGSAQTGDNLALLNVAMLMLGLIVVCGVVWSRRKRFNS